MRKGSAAWTLLALGLLLAGVGANVSEENMQRAYTLHTAHRTEKLMWNENRPDAPLVTDKTINLAREMAMAEAEENEAAAAAKKAADEAKHAEIRAKIVSKITEPFKDYNPLTFIIVGFGSVAIVSVLFWLGERKWLQISLNLQSFSDPEIDQRMYPLF